MTDQKETRATSPLDFKVVETLLAIARNSLDFPRLKAIHDEAVAELEKIAEEAAVRAAEAKKEKEEKEAAEKAAAEKEAADKAEAEKNMTEEEKAAAAEKEREAQQVPAESTQPAYA